MAIEVENRGGAREGGGRKTNESKGLEKRSRMIAFKVTEGEYEAILALAEASDEDVSSFVRAAALAMKGTK